jgi:hypothetical protein
VGKCPCDRSFVPSMNRTTAGVLIGLGLLGCQARPTQDFQLLAKSLPCVQQGPTALPPPLRQDSIHGVWPHFVGRFAVADSLFLAQPLPASAADWLHDFVTRQAVRDSSTLNTDGLELFVDPHYSSPIKKTCP